ncbi:MAG: MFS transporter [Vicinamibacterales bacterium]|jgi:MFS family permease|nr:MFS transporter [Vicinamibacterales bacterium]
MDVTRERLFTPRFFLMCGFSFAVFFSAFQLFPTAPFRIRELGGDTFAAGLFLACLTFASAVSAPFTGALADRFGLRRTLRVGAVALTGFSVGYAVLQDYRLVLALTAVHGVFWSAVLTASAAYMTGILPPTRRAEGIAYWGLASVVALAIGPTFGFWLYQFGWFTLCAVMGALNLVVAVVAWRLPKERPHAAQKASAGHGPLIEWRVLALSVTLMLYSYSYGAITSFAAMYGEAIGSAPKGLYLTVVGFAIIATRPFLGRIADRVGYVRLLVPCLALISVGLVVLVSGGSRARLVLSAVIFGAGYGTAYPVYAAYLLQRVDAARRGAAFGALIAAFDTGIGTGSLVTGWIIGVAGYQAGFGVAAALSALAIPYFFAVRGVLPARPE